MDDETESVAAPGPAPWHLWVVGVLALMFTA